MARCRFYRKANGPFPSSLVPLFQNECKCVTFHMKMNSACSFMFTQIKVIFIRLISHLDSLWNRGRRELGNGLFWNHTVYVHIFMPMYLKYYKGGEHLLTVFSVLQTGFQFLHFTKLRSAALVDGTGHVNRICPDKTVFNLFLGALRAIYKFLVRLSYICFLAFCYTPANNQVSLAYIPGSLLLHIWHLSPLPIWIASFFLRYCWTGLSQTGQWPMFDFCAAVASCVCLWNIPRKCSEQPQLA